MTRDAAWYVRRLRAMSLAEIAHRAVRATRHPFDVARMRAGLYAPVPPALDGWTGPTLFYFDAEVRVPLDTATRERADRLCAGEREVLGLGWLTLSDPPWALEPSRAGSWPMIDAVRVLEVAPAGFDARLTWELNRGHEWVVLARAWAATRDVRYRDRLANELASWRTFNPVGMGINWASAMEAAIRIHSLAWVAGFLRGEALGLIAEMLHTHATFVRRNLAAYSSANNHLLVELSGLAVASRVLHGTADQPALLQLESELVRQTYPDGVNVEMATHYHLFVLEALLLVAHLERRHGAPRPELEHVIHAMARYAAELRCSDGSVLHHGDNDDGKILPFLAPDHAGQLVDAAAALRSPETSSEVWLRGPGSAPPARQSTRFADSGQIVLHSSRLHVVLDAGPFGLAPLHAHAHCDALAINVAVAGVPVIVERGTYRYNGDVERRRHYQSTASHNCAQIDRDEQATWQGPFLWTDAPTVHLELCELSTDDRVHARLRRQSRTLVRRGDLLAIVDRAAGALTSRFHVAPGIAVTLEGPFVRLGPDAWFYSTDPIRLVTTKHSAIYGLEQDATTIEIEGAVTACAIGTGERTPVLIDEILQVARHEGSPRRVP